MIGLELNLDFAGNHSRDLSDGQIWRVQEATSTGAEVAAAGGLAP